MADSNFLVENMEYWLKSTGKFLKQRNTGGIKFYIIISIKSTLTLASKINEIRIL